MEFYINQFSNKKVDLKNTTKGIQITKLSENINENAEYVRNSILQDHKPQFFSVSENKAFVEIFEAQIKDLESEIEKKKMLINLAKRKNVFFAEPKNTPKP